MLIRADSGSMTSPYRPVVLIPVYNHGATIAAVHTQLAALGLPCLLVDDGSIPDCAATLDALATQPHTYLLRRAENGGKGAAVQDGMRRAAQLGFSHALQVDADGQHDLTVIPGFLAASRAAPEALICGFPRYDASVPTLRWVARYLTHVWVWINTLSLRITDSMCGFRVYPLAASVALIDQERLGARMDFDTEFLVRMAWRDQPMQWLPVPVHYPQNGVSHFRPLRDNVLISWMHTRLFFGMLCRAPRLLWRRWRRWRSARLRNNTQP